MGNFIPYAYLKTIDGEEVREYTKENYEKAIAELEYKVAEKNDRILYFVTKNKKVNGISFFKDDYFEVFKEQKKI